MPVYVDPLFDATIYKCAAWKYPKACHMFVVNTADIEDLHDIAARIGLKREWFQGPPAHRLPHYDLTASKRVLAVRHGVTEVDEARANELIREWFRMLHVTEGLASKGREWEEIAATAKDKAKGVS